MSRLEVWNLGYSVPTMIHTGTLTFKDADEEQHADSNSTRFIKGLAEFKLQLKSFLPLSEESPFNKNSVQSCPTLCKPMDRGTPGLAVYHQPPESTQTHVYCVIQPPNHLILCHPLLLLPSIFPSIRVFPMSQLFSSGGQSIGVSASTSALPINTQDWSPLG